MNKSAKIYELEDEDGYRLPKNVTSQFREVQGGIEHLKHAADTITDNLKGVNKKLGKNTTDLSLITDKVNSIDNTLKTHMKNTAASLDNIQDVNKAVLSILTDIFKELNTQGERLSNLETKLGKS